MKHPLKLAIGSDHGGFELKEQLRDYLTGRGHAVADCGTHSREAVDYPRIAFEVASRVATGAADFGIVVDGAGIGSAMAANKVRGVLAAACYNDALARNAREHNDANILTLGSGQTSFAQAQQIADVFLGTECTVDRHRARVRIIKDMEERSMGAQPPSGDPNLTPQDIERIAERVRQLMKAGVPPPPSPRALSPAELAKLIDHTLLKPEATAADVTRLCEEAKKNGFYSVCVNPSFVPHAHGLLQGSGIKVCCVVGFPLGAQSSQIKMLESRKALREGAQEIDMVINIGALKGKDDAAVLKDIRGVVETCRESRAKCKVILETSLLNEEEKVRACELSMKAGADFVKTSTGFSSAGATAEDIALMARVVAPRKLGVKASGGVRTYADVVRMVAAGATRVGCSSSVKIMEEARAVAAGKPVTSTPGSGY
jgi:deoxyribose-phosphate aldolase